MLVKSQKIKTKKSQTNKIENKVNKKFIKLIPKNLERKIEKCLKNSNKI